MRVFLSYSQADIDFAKRLAKALAGYDLNVWFPDRDLLQGDNWSLAIGKALEKSEAMVVVLSRSSQTSEWQRREVQYALASPHYNRRVIPVLLPSIHGIPEEFPWILKFQAVVVATGQLPDTARRIAEALKQQKKADFRIPKSKRSEVA